MTSDAWLVWLEVHDPTGALYIFEFAVPDSEEYGVTTETAAVDWVLEHNVAVRHGYRFVEKGWCIIRAKAVHARFVLAFEVEPIDQPEYKRGRAVQ